MTILDKMTTQALRAATRVVVFTGAGVSAESGIPTFRDKQTGLWEKFDAAELATLDAFERDPPLVWAGTNGAEHWCETPSPTPDIGRLLPWKRAFRTSPW